MKALLIIVLTFICFNLYSQSKEKFTISGYIKEKTSKIGVEGCEISMASPSGLTYRTESDSNGYYSIVDVSIIDLKYEIYIRKNGFFSAFSNVNFYSIPRDTTVNIELIVQTRNVDWLPEIHFEYNNTKPEINFKDTLAFIYRILIENPHLKFKVIGYRDAAETNDLRMERANFVLNELVKLGVENIRLKAEISESPNILKETKYSIDYKTQKIPRIFLSEVYIIQFNFEERERLRQLNRCVSFEISDL